MQNKLQELTDKLYNEGLSKGKQEAEEIVANAKKEAEAILSLAKEKAEAIVADAGKEAEDLKSKVESDVKMASREAIAATRQDIEKLVVAEIAEKPVKDALKDAGFLKEIIKAVAENFSKDASGDLEIILPQNLKDQMEGFVRNELSSMLGRTVSADFTKKNSGGFTIGPKDGSYYISMTDESFAQLIGSYLRPATKKILFG